MQFGEENSQHLKDWIIKRLENMYVSDMLPEKSSTGACGL